jgi:hypothetical protein
MAVRVPDASHVDWLGTAVLRHVLVTTEGFRRSEPTKAEAETPRVAWAIANSIGTLRWTPTAEIAEDCRLVVDWLSLNSRDVPVHGDLKRLSFSKAVAAARAWQRRQAEVDRDTGERVIVDPVDVPVVLDEPLFGNGAVNWSWVWLKSLHSRNHESAALGHKVGSDFQMDGRPTEAFLSLRDSNGKPHVLVHLGGMRVLEAASRWSDELTTRQHRAVARVSAIVGPRLLLHHDAGRRVIDGLHRRGSVSLNVFDEVPHRKNGPAIEWANGSREWRWNGQLHRKDGPAHEVSGGYKAWYIYGVRHREDGPAIDSGDGHREWYRHGRLHREGGPAMQHANGYRAWYLNGELHRDAGPAVEHTNGGREWYRQGLLHREDGPAVVYADGGQEWHRNGRLHRYDGPAIEHPNGEAEWFQDGRRHREDGPALCRLEGPDEWYLDGIQVAAEVVEERMARPGRP